MSVPKIRLLQPSDIDAAEEILNLAFTRPGNRRRDLGFALKMTPDCYFLAEEAGVPVGMVGAVVYDRYAWVGLMAVDPRRQSKGIGRALMNHLLGELDRRNLAMVLLDASGPGHPLYLSLGFSDEDKAWMYERKNGEVEWPDSPANDPAAPCRIRLADPTDLTALRAFDARNAGADRGKLLDLFLNEFPGRAFLTETAPGQLSGYLIAQTKRIGPWFAEDSTSAECLLRGAMTLYFEEPAQVIVPERNSDADRILRRFGFLPAYSNIHMRRGGTALTGRRETMYGQASFGFG